MKVHLAHARVRDVLQIQTQSMISDMRSGKKKKQGSKPPKGSSRGESGIGRPHATPSLVLHLLSLPIFPLFPIIRSVVAAVLYRITKAACGVDGATCQVRFAPNLRGDVMVPIPKFVHFAAAEALDCATPHHTTRTRRQKDAEC